MDPDKLIFYVILGLYVASAIRKSMKKQKDGRGKVGKTGPSRQRAQTQKPRKKSALDRLREKLEEMGREFSESMEMGGGPSRRRKLPASEPPVEKDLDDFAVRASTEKRPPERKAPRENIAESLPQTPLLFGKPEGVVQALVLSEILAPPLSRRPRGPGGVIKR